jgi:hypothetical protein
MLFAQSSGPVNSTKSLSLLETNTRSKTRSAADSSRLRRIVRNSSDVIRGLETKTEVPMVVRLETLTLLREPRNPGIAVASREQLRIADSPSDIGCFSLVFSSTRGTLKHWRHWTSVVARRARCQEFAPRDTGKLKRWRSSCGARKVLDGLSPRTSGAQGAGQICRLF